MGVLDGQPVNQSITNPAFINKNIDDVMPNKLGFSRSGSGSSIADIQQAVNNLYTATGVSETQTGTVYNAPPSTINNGDPYQTALTKLANKFDAVTGHKHTGASGDAPQISASSLSGNLLISSFNSGTNASTGTFWRGDGSWQPAVQSLAASGSTAIAGDIVLAASGSTTLTESGQTITIFSPASGSAVNSIAASGSAALTGAVVLAASGAVTLTESGQTITIFAPASGTAVNSLAASGNAALTGAVLLVAGTNVTLSQSGQDITISAASGSGMINPMTKTGDMIYALNNAGTPVRLPGNTTTTKQFLNQTGDSINSAAPVWDVLSTGDIPAIDLSAGNVNGGVVNLLPPSNMTLSPNGLYNLGLSTSVSASAFTISLTTSGGSTPSAGSGAVGIVFRNATSTTGTNSLVSATASTTITAPTGASLGQTSAADQYVWVYALNNSGTIELAISGVKVFDDLSIQSTTTIASSSTSGTTLYSTTGRSNVPIRLIGRLKVNETTAGTWASNASEVSVKPVPLPNITDWTSYAPTGAWTTNTTYVGYWRRVGDTLEVHARASTSGAPTSATFTLSYPSGFVADSNKLPAVSGLPSLGHSDVQAAGNHYNGDVVYATSSTVEVIAITNAAAATNNSVFVTQAAPNTFGSGDYVDVVFSVPISGWNLYGP